MRQVEHGHAALDTPHDHAAPIGSKIKMNVIVQQVQQLIHDPVRRLASGRRNAKLSLARLYLAPHRVI
jgi:hypothetical protein